MKFIFTLLACFVVTTAWAEDSVEIESQQMSVDHLHGHAEFKGGVRLLRGDFELRCDRLLAYYHNNELQRAEAFGRVRMQQGIKHGASKRATFNRQNNILTLIGEASVEDKDGVIRGETITHNIKTKHTQVTQGSSGRVRLSIESNDQTDKKP